MPRNRWQPLKDKASFNQGRDALRGDRLAGNYNTCPLADVGPGRGSAGKWYAREVAKAERHEKRVTREQGKNYRFVVDALARVERKPKVYGKGKKAAV